MNPIYTFPQSPSGFFGENRVCVQCSGCRTCDSREICTSCAVPLFLLGTRCVPNCTEGVRLYPELAGRVCRSCHERCAECFGPSDSECSRCEPGSYLDSTQNTCLEVCPDGYFASEDALRGGLCAPCSTPCRTCSAADG